MPDIQGIRKCGKGLAGLGLFVLVCLTLSSNCDELDTTPPAQVNLYPVPPQDSSFVVTWPPSDDEDFDAYRLYEAPTEDMADKLAIYETHDRNDTLYVVQGIGEYEKRFYQLGVLDQAGNEALSEAVMARTLLKIVYLKCGGDCESTSLKIMDENGNHNTNLVGPSSSLYSTEFIKYHQFTPDGRKILFIGRHGYIYTIELDGSNETLLYTIMAGDLSSNPFHPDGSRMAISCILEGNYEISVINLDGTNATRLTFNEDRDSFPVFSPDGEKIVYMRDKKIYIVDTDGSNQTLLLDYGYYPQFSPDGSTIMYVSSSPAGNSMAIYTMDVDGTNHKMLADDIFNFYDVQYSPDGSQIVFSATQGGNIDIYIMDSDGSNQTRLTNSVGKDTDTRFSPDGAKILFQSYRDGNSEIYIMNNDGSNQIRLTESSFLVCCPEVQPLP